MLRVIFQALDDNLDGVLDWSEFQDRLLQRPQLPAAACSCTQLTANSNASL